MTIKVRKDIKSGDIPSLRQSRIMEYFLFKYKEELARKFFDEVYVCFKNDEIVAMYKSDFDIETVKDEFDCIMSPTKDEELQVPERLINNQWRHKV